MGWWQDGSPRHIFLPHNNIPENRSKDVIYGRVVVSYLTQKDDPYRTRLK